MVRYKPVQDWKNCEKKVGDNGYIIVKVAVHPKSFGGGWYYEHRLIIEKMMGRVLETWETVHHISENRLDNSLENLFPCTRKEHDRAIWLTSEVR